MDLESSGLTPIDVAFLQSIMMNAHLPKCVKTEVYLVTSPEDEFISCYLDKMEADKEGRFKRSKRTESLSLKTFFCERHEKPRGKSQGNPSKTRANSCKSYVSFKFTGDGIRKACLVRKNGKHCGHCLDDPQEWKVNRIHPSVISLIKKLGREGLNKEEIALRVKNWASKDQIVDCRDRRFYPTSQDIRYLMSRVPKKEKTPVAGKSNMATTFKMESQKDDDVGNKFKTSYKILGVGMKWQSEETNSFSYIILKKPAHQSHKHEDVYCESERLSPVLETEKEPNIKTACSSMNPEEEPTALTLDLMSSSSAAAAAIPPTSTSNILASSSTHASLEDPPTLPSSDILLSFTPQQILPPVPQTLISNKDSNILTLSPSPKALTSKSVQGQKSLNQQAPKVGIPFFTESTQSTNELPGHVAEIHVSSTETASNQILLPQFVEITSPMKLISTTSSNGQLLTSKRFSPSNMVSTNFTNAPASITMTTDEPMPISLSEISPSTVTFSLPKDNSSLSSVGLTLSSDGLLLTGIPFSTDSILTTNQEIETPEKYTEEISSTTPLPIYTLHYNSLKDDSNTISYVSSKPIDSKDEVNIEMNNSNLEESISHKKRDKECTEIIGSIIDRSVLSTGGNLSSNRADCLQQSYQNPSEDIEENSSGNSLKLPITNEEPHSQKNTETKKGHKQLEVEETSKCSIEDKILILVNETSKTSCLVQAKIDKGGKRAKLSLTEKRTSQSLKSAEDSIQTESSQSKDNKQQPKKRLKSNSKRTKSDSFLEQPLKKRKVLSQIRPTLDKQRNYNIHTQLKTDNLSEKKVFSYTTPLLLYNISQGRLHRLGITEDEMRRRTSPPEKLNLRALQALLQTHKKKQWKQNLKNKMLDSSITVNEGQSGYLTAFTRLSEEEVSHLEFELLQMVANPNHVKINSIVQELVTEAIPNMETDKEIQAKNYLKNLQMTRQTLDEIYQKFMLHSENFSLITHTFGTSCMGVMKSVFDDILEKTMQRTMEEIGNA